MKFEWDAKKAKYNATKHFVRFEYATLLFESHLAFEIDVSNDADGEQRLKRIGPIFGRLHSVVFTMRGENIRIISARRANEKEEKYYHRFFDQSGETP